MSKFRKVISNSSGFTLVEVMIVMGIVAVGAYFASEAMVRQQRQQQAAAIAANFQALKLNANQLAQNPAAILASANAQQPISMTAASYTPVVMGVAVSAGSGTTSVGTATLSTASAAAYGGTLTAAPATTGGVTPFSGTAPSTTSVMSAPSSMSAASASPY